MPVSINDLSVHEKIKTMIMEGSQYLSHFQIETEVVTALISENYPRTLAKEILDTVGVCGATYRSIDKGYKCPSGCACAALGEFDSKDKYFIALWSYCQRASKTLADQEIGSMEEELGFVVEKVTIYESTEVTIRFDVIRDEKKLSFMIEPEKMYLPSEFAKAVLGKIQTVINVPPRKRWPLLIKKWLDGAERVVAKEQTTFGLIAENLATFIITTGIESDPDHALEEVDKGNVTIVEVPNQYFLAYFKVSYFLDYLDRNKVKLFKNSVISFLARTGWYQKQAGRGRIRVWRKSFQENPISSETSLIQLLSQESLVAEKQPGESDALPNSSSAEPIPAES